MQVQIKSTDDLRRWVAAARQLVKQGRYGEAESVIAACNRWNDGPGGMRAFKAEPSGAGDWYKAGPYQAPRQAPAAVRVAWSGMKSVADYGRTMASASGSLANTVTLEARQGSLRVVPDDPVVRRQPDGETRYGFRLVRLTTAGGKCYRILEGDL